MMQDMMGGMGWGMGLPRMTVTRLAMLKSQQAANRKLILLRIAAVQKYRKGKQAQAVF
ncbi:hypothetical protein [Xanthobacter autotrophicus]|uniref:hypothetical protein n=1 Tax=Xanthobacter autotrophicus TaxID=280 RepID=UPI0012EDE24D